MLTTYKTDLKPFKDLALSFAARELAKKTGENDRYPFGPLFTETIDKAREVGFLSVMLPEELGGIGGGISTLCVILENICRTDASMGGIIFTNGLSQAVMLAAGASALAKEVFTDASGTGGCLAAFPSYLDPSQAPGLPKAEGAAGAYTLTGRLEFLVLGNLAGWAVIPARTEGSPYSFFLVDLAGEGIVKGEPIFSMGMHACPAIDVTLGGVKARLIGEEGKGGEYFAKASGTMHAASAAMNSGIVQGSYEEAEAYARERFQGGREIIGWSEVAMMLAGMAIKKDVARMCVSQACQSLERSDGPDTSVTAASIHVHELACDAVTDGVQVLGGNGYMKDYGQEKRYRDARQVQALLGSSPMKKIALIRELAGK